MADVERWGEYPPRGNGVLFFCYDCREYVEGFHHRCPIVTIGRVQDLDEAAFVRLAMNIMEPENYPIEELMRK